MYFYINWASTINGTVNDGMDFLCIYLMISIPVSTFTCIYWLSWFGVSIAIHAYIEKRACGGRKYICSTRVFSPVNSPLSKARHCPRQDGKQLYHQVTCVHHPPGRKPPIHSIHLDNTLYPKGARIIIDLYRKLPRSINSTKVLASCYYSDGGAFLIASYFKIPAVSVVPILAV